MKYPVFTPHISTSDVQYVAKSLEEGWVSSTGPYIRLLEDEISNYLNCQFTTTVCNGSAALEVGLAALGINSGEVILPSFTIASCAYAIQRVGATPVFVDVEPDYFCIDPEKVESLINEHTKCIMLVNMYGNTCDVDAFLRIRDTYSIPILEDCSENLGGAYGLFKSGSQFDVATFSLYANKTITSGEGGLVCTSCPDIHHRARRYKNLDFPDDRSFTHDSNAFNYRMASPLAALAVSQLSRIDDILYRKDQVFNSYLKYIDLNLLTPLNQRSNTRFVPWMNCFLAHSDLMFDYKSFESYMGEHGIQVRPFFSNLAIQKSFRRHVNAFHFPVTDLITNIGFYLPSGTSLNDSDIKFISNTCNSYFRK
jgi:perosamine synthetase